MAVLQLGDAQKELVRSFAIPCPTRQVVLLTNKNFIRHTLLEVLVKEIKLSVPKGNALTESNRSSRIDFIYRSIKSFNRIFCSIGEKCYIFANRKSEGRLHLSIIKQTGFLHSVCTIFALVKQKTKPIKKRKIMEPIINSQLPEFKVQAFQNGSFKTVSHEDVKGKWAIFFFYPADFTFVCPTELVDIAEKYDQFQAMGVEVYSVSTDSHFVHKAWHDASESIRKIKYPPCLPTPQAY